MTNFQLTAARRGAGCECEAAWGSDASRHEVRDGL